VAFTTFEQMVKVMPTQNLNLWLQKATRVIFAGAGCLMVVFCAFGSVLAQKPDGPQPDDWSSSIFSTYGITISLALLLIGLLVFKKVRAEQNKKEIAALKSAGRSTRQESKFAAPTVSQPQAHLSESIARSPQSLQLSSQSIEFEPSAYGAYRIDQEVGKLILGKPHRMDVMASRAPEDRRAIEASLVKALESYDSTEEGRLRARRALEEYGFIARQSAVMLMGRDAWERSSAARTLGQVRSPSSLTFLIEALHDPDSVVRNQAVSSLGALKMPAAIGALLDIARRHPDIPVSLLSQTLSACSVESLGYLDSSAAETPSVGEGQVGTDLPEFEPFKSFENLPEGNEDAELTVALGQLENADEQIRGRVVRELGMHHAQRSVSALSSMVINDLDPAVRAAAVASLGAIDHESVLAPVLIGLADESRIVRAAAARTLTSLHFDRADAYVRVMETSDQETLQHVARACISTGLVAQAVDRLASEDRHQAYEAFSLFSLLARAKEVQPIIDVIENHQDDEARLCAVRVLNVAATSEVTPQLRQMVASESMPDNVRTAVLEVLFKLDADQPATEPQVTTTP
jgi:HEAT repeat protein